MLQPVQKLLHHTHYGNETQGDTPSGVPFSLKCDLCGLPQKQLTPIDFKDMVWIQGNSFQPINQNQKIKKFELELCYDCHKRLFSRSKVTIYFNQRLFDCLKEVKNGKF